jgi:hypothetical protein
MTAESPPRQNNRLITAKGQPFESWWHPIEQYLTGRSPVFKSFQLVGAAAFMGNDLFVAKDTTFMMAVRNHSEGMSISGFIIASEKKGWSDPSGYHFFDALLDTTDVKTAWKIAALLDNVFNCVPLDPEHQEELERLLFSA